MADENNDYGYLVSVDYSKIDETIDKLHDEIKSIKERIEELKNNNPETIERIRREVEYEVNAFQCAKVIEKLNQRKEQSNPIHTVLVD